MITHSFRFQITCLCLLPLFVGCTVQPPATHHLDHKDKGDVGQPSDTGTPPSYDSGTNDTGTPPLNDSGTGDTGTPPLTDTGSGDTGAPPEDSGLGECLNNNGCFIDGICIPNGQASPHNPCQFCQPNMATDQWSPEANGEDCDDENRCTVNTQCQNGVCTGQPLDCTSTNQCLMDGTCNEHTGECDYQPKPDDTACDNGDPNASARCLGGQCIEDNCVCNGTSFCCDGCQAINLDQECSDRTQCSHSTCNSLGICATIVEDDKCLISDTCYREGDLHPESPCRACRPEIAQTTWSNLANNTSCDNGDLCTVEDFCRNGTCLTGEPKCPPPNQCHHEGECDPDTGACSEVPKEDNSSCENGNRCTEEDYCLGGECQGGSEVVCPTLENPCQESVCDINRGCVVRNKENGSECELNHLQGSCFKGQCQTVVVDDSCEQQTDGAECLSNGQSGVCCSRRCCIGTCVNGMCHNDW